MGDNNMTRIPRPSKVSPGNVFILVVILQHFLVPVVCQFDPRDQHTNTFYLTSRTDCDDKLKNIYNNEAIVQGYDLANSGAGTKTCTIAITSKQALYQSVQLQLEIKSADILDCGVQLSIYDGQGTQLLTSFNCQSSQNNNRLSPVTSGDTVTFILTRDDTDSHQFDIEIRVKPVRGGWDPGDDRSPENFFNFQKFEQRAIVGMIGGFYALVIIICVCTVIYCYTHYKGMNKKWETHQLSTMKTDASLAPSQGPWSVGAPSQRGPTSHYSRAYTETYSRKGPATTRSEDGSSVYDHDERFQQRNLMNDERDRYRGRDRMASQNTTYTDEDNEDPNNFKEKIITPTVRSRGKWKAKQRDRRPPSFEEATRESSADERTSDDASEDDDTEESSDNDSTRKRLTTSSEEENSETETETETESDDSEESSRRGARGGRRGRKTKNDKRKDKKKPRRKDQSFSDDASSRRTEPRSNQPRPPLHPQPMPGAMAYGAYPQPGGQFVPIMAGPAPQFQPVPMVPPNYPPPQYLAGPSVPAAPNNGQVKPTEPPVYSYLVRRGYTPVDAPNRHNSPAGSVASNQRNREEPDVPLESGVEYMRR